jgi:Iap family predicted aminopeptidase
MFDNEFSQYVQQFEIKEEIFYFDSLKKQLIAVENQRFIFVNIEYISHIQRAKLCKKLLEECEMYILRKEDELRSEYPELFL